MLSFSLSFAEQSSEDKKSKFAIPKDIKYNKPSKNGFYSIAVIGGGAAGSQAANKCLANNKDVLFVVGENKNHQQAHGMWAPEFGNAPALARVKTQL